MQKYDVIVIGGGLLGCFAARNLARYKLNTVIMEAREDLCTGISRANTAIIYSGANAKHGTLKSRMCVNASHTFGDLCGELGVRYSQCGSITVCFGPEGEEKLRDKFEDGIKSGVHGLKLVTREEILKMEPHLNADVRLGLFSPEDGTVIPWELGLAAAENAVHNGTELNLKTKVSYIKRVNNGYEVFAGNTVFFTRGIMNCAGLFADEILEKVQKPSLRLFPNSGNYIILDTKITGFVSHIISQETEQRTKGLTLVPTVDGNILVGPTKTSSGEKDGFETYAEGLDRLGSLVAEVMPELPMEQTIRSFGAIRPNPYYVHYDSKSGSYVREEGNIGVFEVNESKDNPAFLSLIGIKTPGVTCANELGRDAADKMAAFFGAEMNPAFDPIRPAPKRLAELPINERSQLAEENTDYGKIVCRCRTISEGEIIDSIHRNPGAVSVDGVKRRTGACSGRCQGSFCTQRIIEILARELKIPPESVNKDGPDSYLIGGAR
ncbi:MAG: NAD(P)/FAD-dependent oxidoreductase [Oscillospiraceae bacterium]